MQEGEGWILYAWLMLIVAGGFAIIDGIIAVSRSSFFTATGAHYVVSDLNTWGWIAIILGAIAVAAAFGVARGGQLGRWTGITIASIQLLVQIGWIPIIPFWALTIIVLDMLVIYALAVYGGRGEAA
jgi:hypothetical protein